MGLSRAVSSLTFAAVLLAAPCAFGQTDSDKATARDFGERGQTALTAKDYKKAAEYFAKAHTLFDAAPTLTLGLARADAQLGKIVEAVELYNKIIHENVATSAGFRKALEDAATEIEPLKARRAKVTITVAAQGGGDVPNAKVMLDGQEVPAVTLGSERFVDPGDHGVTVTAAGYKQAEQKFSVAEAGATSAALQLEKDPNAVVTPGTGPGPTPGPTVDSGTSSQGGGSKVPAIVAFAVGGAGLATGAIFGLIAMSDHSSLSSGACSSGTCPPSASSDLSSYHTAGAVSTAAFIVGGVGVATGAVLFLLAGSKSPEHASVTPYVGLGSVGAFGRF